METDVPPALQPNLETFKQSLIDTVQAELGCAETAPANAEQVQSVLIRLLQANKPEKPFTPDPPDFNTPVTGDYGDDLKVDVKAVPKHPDLMSIQITYDIECGEDNILLLYRHTPSGWERELVYKSPILKNVGEAFGDFFQFSLVPSDPRQQYLVAAAHGAPWCSSRMSEFSVDLLSPSAGGRQQARLDHVNYAYSRGDATPRLKPEPDGFELRLNLSSRDINFFEYTGIFRYITTDGKLQRIQPIANNARAFVDEWLDSPWKEASQWTDASTPQLKAASNRFDFSLHPDYENVPEIEFGPTRACTSDPHLFQVQLNLSEGTKEEKHSNLYAQVRQNPNSFTMLSITPQPDPTCNGPDLMKPAKR